MKGTISIGKVPFIHINSLLKLLFYYNNVRAYINIIQNTTSPKTNINRKAQALL